MISHTVLPELTPITEAFWTGGRDGKLIIMACQSCDHRIHPPQPVCPNCLSRAVAPRAASGDGTIYSFTVNHQPWLPGLPVPYVLVCVDLDDQPGVRITARLKDVDPAEVAIGQKVRVDFEAHEDVFIPVFHLDN